MSSCEDQRGVAGFSAALPRAPTRSKLAVLGRSSFRRLDENERRREDPAGETRCQFGAEALAGARGDRGRPVHGHRGRRRS